MQYFDIKYISNLIDKIKNLFIYFFEEVLILCFSLFNNHFKIQTRKVKIHYIFIIISSEIITKSSRIEIKHYIR